MTLVKRNGGLFPLLSSEFEKSLLSPELAFEFFNPAFSTPRANIEETEKDVIVDIEMPGLTKEDISVELEENEVTVFGRQRNVLPKDARILYSERSPQNYHRTFSLGAEIDKSKMKASYENGILKLTLMKVEKPQPKKITIE